MGSKCQQGPNSNTHNHFVERVTHDIECVTNPNDADADTHQDHAHAYSNQDDSNSYGSCNDEATCRQSGDNRDSNKGRAANRRGSAVTDRTAGGAKCRIATSTGPQSQLGQLVQTARSASQADAFGDPRP